ncbi:MAG: tetratricopeptide repeat protein, partial [Isosphaeraceae bacterium]
MKGMLVAWAVSAFLGFVPADEPTQAERQALEAKAAAADKDAERLYDEGKPAEAADRYQEALAIRERLFPPETFPEGHPAVQESLGNLGAALEGAGRLYLAESRQREALALARRVYPIDRYPDGHDAIAVSLCNLGMVVLKQGRFAAGEETHRDALAMRRRLYPASRYPDGHPDVA